MGPTWHHSVRRAVGHRVSRSASGLFVILLLLHLTGSSALATSGFATLADFPVPGGHFFSQASGHGLTAGYSLVDDAAARMYSEFQRHGSVDSLGYPSSQRFSFDGFTTQATQKELLQWRPDSGRISFVNIFDVLTDRGLDSVLAQTRLIPATADNSADAQLKWPQVVTRHLAILDQVPAIRARYFEDKNSLDDYGLPQAVGDYGAVQVIRCERAAFQLWRIATPFAKPGDVTQVNAGDLAKELGVIPPSAVVPTTAGELVVAPPGVLIAPDALTQNTARQVAAQLLPSLVRIDVTLDDGIGIASGIVIDRNGDILTNEHVVSSARSVKVTFVNGTSQTARVVAADASNDIAIIQVPPGAVGAGVNPALMVGGGKLTPGQFVIALGFSPYFPAPPAIRLGVFQAVIDGDISVLKSDTFILPGDSGGMLLDLAGNVVGVNDEIRITRQESQPLIGFSIDSAQALQVGQRLLQSAPTQ